MHGTSKIHFRPFVNKVCLLYIKTYVYFIHKIKYIIIFISIP